MFLLVTRETESNIYSPKGLPQLPNGQLIGLPNGLPQGAKFGLPVIMALIPGSNQTATWSERIEQDDYTIINSICIHRIQASTNKQAVQERRSRRAKADSTE